MNSSTGTSTPEKPPPQHAGWDAYWATDASGSRRLYSFVASIYRRIFICPRLAWWLTRTFPTGSRLLHAGCGGGEVDAWVTKRFRITGLDISLAALAHYRRNNPHAEGTVHADLLNVEDVSGGFDGVYSLGVLEHFTPSEIGRILANMRSLLRPGGKVVAFWPLRSAPSVKVLGLWHRLLNRHGKQTVELHPAEITLISSRSQVEEILHAAGWRLETYAVSPWDLCVQAVIVCE